MKYTLDKNRRMVLIEVENKGDLFVLATIIASVNNMLIKQVKNAEFSPVIKSAVNILLSSIGDKQITPVMFYSVAEDMLNAGNGTVVLDAGDGWRLVVKRI